MYLASYSAGDKAGQGGGVAEENELIEVLELSVTTVDKMIENDEIDDLKTDFLIRELQRQLLVPSALRWPSERSSEN